MRYRFVAATDKAIYDEVVKIRRAMTGEAVECSAIG
jgi:hypothetical protein